MAASARLAGARALSARAQAVSSVAARSRKEKEGRRKDVWAPFFFLLSSVSRRLAGPVRRVLQIAAALVGRVLRIWTHRAGHPAGAGAHDLVRRHALLAPLFQRAQRIDRVDARTVAAVRHAGYEEQA